MNKIISRCFTLFFTLSFSTIVAQQTNIIWLDELPIQTFSEGIRPVAAKSNYGKDTMSVKGVKYLRGIGAQSISIINFDLNKQAKHFSAMVGVDDQGNKEIPLLFYVLGDGKLLFSSKERMIGDEPVNVEVDLTGIKQLGLLILDKVGGVSNKRTYANSTPYISSYAGYVGNSSEFPKGGETHDLIKINRQSFMHIGKYRFETIDAKQMARWGFDFLKYDWRIDINSTERMSNALKKSGRDIVFSLSNNSPFEKTNDWMRLSHMYRTGPDIKDSWNSLYATVFSLDKWAPFTGPGHWSDPDMMIVGDVAIGHELHPTRLTADEQYSHVSIFSLLAAPMLIGCPIENLDAFTLNLLTNDEVIAINQDPLGKAGRLLLHEKGIEVWVKQLEDGSYGVGIFNTDGFGDTPQSYFRWGDEKGKSYTLDFARIGLKGNWQIRDVWRQKSLGQYTGSFKTNIPYHGVVLLKVSPPNEWAGLK